MYGWKESAFVQPVGMDSHGCLCLCDISHMNLSVYICVFSFQHVFPPLWRRDLEPYFEAHRSNVGMKVMAHVFITYTLLNNV